MLSIVGGTYLEECQEPISYELYGSGLRAAAALADKGFEITFKSCVGEAELDAAVLTCKTLGINPVFEILPETITFSYYHPLSQPIYYPEIDIIYQLSDTDADNILLYGQIEAKAKVSGKYVVYDPQNWISFKETGSIAEHLAIVLNRKEAYLLSALAEETLLTDVGRSLLKSEQADIVIIKNGSQGALVIEEESSLEIPVFDTMTVWPIGSGDIFSAAFAWKWMIERLPAADAALFASQYTAYYCETQVLPLPHEPKYYRPLTINKSHKKIYLAGPFFTITERWLIEELRTTLLDFNNSVFSPYHDVGVNGTSEEIVEQDLQAIQNCDVMFAILSGSDVGTIFEIGYAKALGKKVVVLAENVRENDLLMLIGSNCIITTDISTAVYKASW